MGNYSWFSIQPIQIKLLLTENPSALFFYLSILIYVNVIVWKFDFHLILEINSSKLKLFLLTYLD